MPGGLQKCARSRRKIVIREEREREKESEREREKVRRKEEGGLREREKVVGGDQIAKRNPMKGRGIDSYGRRYCWT